MRQAEARSDALIPLPRRDGERRAELEFLPAALEIMETPASPLGRAIGATIILFFAAAIAWSYFGHVDIIATASGKIVPTGRTKVIQPFETGVVRAINVQDGQAVKAGDVLVELDPTISGAERDRLAKELLAAELDVARLKAALVEGADPMAAFVPPRGASPAQIDTHRTLLQSQIEAIRAKLGSTDRQIAQAEASRGSVQAEIDKLNQAIPLLKKRAEARNYLADKGYGSKLDSLSTQQDLVEHEQELRVQQAKLAEAAAALSALKEQRHETLADYRRTNLGDLAQAEQKAASLKEQLIQAEQRRQLQTLTAPVDGTVQQLAVHTVGGVVTPAQPLMAIVPADSRLEVEASVPNRDIGFVHEGQEAEIKIDTFNFTRYGLVHGRVLSVAQDAVARERPAEKSGAAPSQGSLAESSEPQGQELVYAARVSLDRTEMQVEDRLVKLAPGMAVTVEIKTGSRRVIEYLLAPLLRYKQAALRER